MLTRSKIGERGLLGVPKDCKGSREKTKLLFEAVDSAVSYCVHWELREIAANLGENAS